MIKKILVLCLIVGNVWSEQTVRELVSPLLDDKELRTDASRIIPESKRGEAIEYLHEIVERKVYGNRTSAEILLINLNDTDQIQLLIEDLRSSNPLVSRRASSPLGQSSQVSVIPYLAEHIYKEEPDIFQLYKDIDIICLSVRSSQAILSILSRSPDVSDEVREWAKKHDYQMFGPETAKSRTVVRLWWPQNKRFFETGEYGKIRPLIDEVLGESLIEVESSRSAMEHGQGDTSAAAPRNAAPLVSGNGKTQVVATILVLSGGLFWAIFRFMKR